MFTKTKHFIKREKERGEWVGQIDIQRAKAIDVENYILLKSGKDAKMVYYAGNRKIIFTSQSRVLITIMNVFRKNTPEYAKKEKPVTREVIGNRILPFKNHYLLHKVQYNAQTHRTGNATGTRI